MRGRPVPVGDSEEETESQVTYRPVAQKATSLNTLTPRNLADPIARATQALVDKHGPLDNYVADKLGISSQAIPSMFSAEQVYGLTMALDNIERGSAAIIGDQLDVVRIRLIGMIAMPHA